MIFQQLDALAKQNTVQSTWYIALSGGVDSVVLLHLCVHWCRQQVEQGMTPPRLNALHINHGLSENSEQWQQFCQALCADLSVGFIAEPVGDLIQGESNLESQARDARYSVFEKYLAAPDLLLLGHHQDDQLETFLLRAFRGSGPQGLGGMPETRCLGKGKLHRPLLSVNRNQLMAYAKQHQLDWIEDESNHNTDFDRNYIRHTLSPVIKERWPNVGDTITRSAQLCRDSQSLLNDLAELDLAPLVSKGLWGEPRLYCEQIKKLSIERQTNVLRFWFSQHKSFEKPVIMPSQYKLQQVLSDVVYTQSDSSAQVVWGDYACRAFKGYLYLLDLKMLKQSEQGILHTPELEWCVANELVLPCGGALLSAAKTSQDLTVRYRQGGEQITLEKRGSKKLKAVLQELEVPPWYRERLPLVYQGEELIALADLCLSAKAKALLPDLRYQPYMAKR